MKSLQGFCFDLQSNYLCYFVPTHESFPWKSRPLWSCFVNITQQLMPLMNIECIMLQFSSRKSFDNQCCAIIQYSILSRSMVPQRHKNPLAFLRCSQASGSLWGLLSGGRALKTSPGRPFWRDLDQFTEPPRLDVESPSQKSWPSHCVSEGQPWQPNWFQLLVSVISFVLSLPTACNQRSPMHGVSICPSLLNNTLRYLNSSIRSHSPPERTLSRTLPQPGTVVFVSRSFCRLCSLNLVVLFLGPDCPHMLHLLPILPFLPRAFISASQAPGALASCIPLCLTCGFLRLDIWIWILRFYSAFWLLFVIPVWILIIPTVCWINQSLTFLLLVHEVPDKKTHNAPGVINFKRHQQHCQWMQVLSFEIWARAPDFEISEGLLRACRPNTEVKMWCEKLAPT